MEEFLAQLNLGLAKLAFSHADFKEAETRFKQTVEQYPDTEAAPESLYWAGVSRYKGTNDAAALEQTGEAFRSRYTDTTWAKKASVWVPAKSAR